MTKRFAITRICSERGWAKSCMSNKIRILLDNQLIFDASIRFEHTTAGDSHAPGEAVLPETSIYSVRW